MDFAIFDPRVFFSVFTLTLHAYIYKRVFNPSPFTSSFSAFSSAWQYKLISSKYPQKGALICCVKNFNLGYCL